MIKPFHELTGRAREGRVNEFRVWRAARAADWDCTARELADETGLHIATVRRICDRRGWSHMLADAQGGGYDVREVDVSMKYGVMG